MAHEIGWDTFSYFLSKKLYVTLGSPLTPTSLHFWHFCDLDYTTLYHLLESLKTCDVNPIPLYLSLMEKRRSAVSAQATEGQSIPHSKKKNDRDLSTDFKTDFGP